jgi:transposase-like protein
MGIRGWTLAEKRAAVEGMKSCGHDKLAAELKIQRRQLYAWRAQLKRLDSGLSSDRGSRKDSVEEIRRLQEALAKKVLEGEFFRGGLRRIEARRRPNEGIGEAAFTNKCE